jgi:hypothetical protein
MSREPDLVKLVGDDVSAEEFERLRRAHELLVAAGPPPELTPELERAPVPGREAPSNVEGLPSRHRGRVLALALGFAAVTLVVGYLFGARNDNFNTDFTVRMEATAAAPAASAIIDVGEIDDSGNWPLRMKVRGLPEQPERAYYELFLTRKGKPAASCGTFRVHEGTTEVRLNAPYRFSRYDGWIVRADGPAGARTGALLRVDDV